MLNWMAKRIPQLKRIALPTSCPIHHSSMVLGGARRPQLRLESRHVTAICPHLVHRSERNLQCASLLSWVEHVLHQEAIIGESLCQHIPLQHTHGRARSRCVVAWLHFESARSGGQRRIRNAELPRACTRGRLHTSGPPFLKLVPVRLPTFNMSKRCIASDDASS